MAPHSLIILLLLAINTNTSHGLNILDKLARIKDSLLAKVGLGDNNCGCPCREYGVIKCDVEWVEHCYQEHYETKCEKRQAFKPRMAREIECQKCRVFPVTVMRPRDFKECAPVYSEECETQYEQHCKVNKRCVMIYQTQCHASNAYTQTCQQVPAQTCYPETVCHKTPHTKCHQTRTQKCTKVVREVPVEEQAHQCLSFSQPSRAQPVITPGYCSAGAGGGHGHDQGHGGGDTADYIAPGGLTSGYSAPGGLTDSYGAPSGGGGSYNSVSGGGAVTSDSYTPPNGGSGYGVSGSGGVLDTYSVSGGGAVSSHGGVTGVGLTDSYPGGVTGGGLTDSYPGGLTGSGYSAPGGQPDSYGTPIGGLLTSDVYGGGGAVFHDNSLGDSYGTAAGSVFSVAGRRAGEGVAVAAAAIDSLQTAALDSLQGVMAWLPQRSNRRSGRGEERERRRSRPMDTSAWLPIDGPS